MIRPHPAFRLFATTNTMGLGDTSGLYHGTQQINQGQMDRWSIVATLNYLPHDGEVEHRARRRRKRYTKTEPSREAPSANMVRVADLTAPGLHQRRPLDRHEPAHGDRPGPRTPRSSSDIGFAFRLTFLNKCDELGAPAWWPSSTSALLRTRAARERGQRRAGLVWGSTRDVRARASRLPDRRWSHGQQTPRTPTDTEGGSELKAARIHAGLAQHRRSVWARG